MIAFQFSGPKTIVVFGATGQQGGSVVRAMKDDKRFVLKAATKNTESESAKKLAAQGQWTHIFANHNSRPAINSTNKILTTYNT